MPEPVAAGIPRVGKSIAILMSIKYFSRLEESQQADEIAKGQSPSSSSAAVSPNFPLHLLDQFPYVSSRKSNMVCLHKGGSVAEKFAVSAQFPEYQASHFVLTRGKQVVIFFQLV